MALLARLVPATVSRVAAREMVVPEVLAASTLRHRFARGAWWSLVGAGSSRAITLFAGVTAARMLGPTGFGELGVVQSTHALFGSLAGLGLGMTAARFVAEHSSLAPARAGRIIALSSVMSLGTGLVMALAFWGLSPWLASHVLAASYLTSDLRLATGLLLFGAINGAQWGALAGLEAFKAIATLGVLRAIVGTACMLLGLHHQGISGGIIGLVAGEFTNVVLSQRVLQQQCARRGVPVLWSEWYSEIPLIWRFSFPALLGSIATMPALWAAKVWLVNQPNGYALAGAFDAANRWALLILFLPSAIAPVQLPLLASLWSHGNRTGYRKLVQANLAVAAGICVVPGIAFAIFSARIMAIYGVTFRQGSATLAILSFSSLGVAMNTVLGNSLIGIGRIWQRCGIDYLLAAILSALAWWLIPLHGAVGLAIASAAAYGVASVVLGGHLWWASRDSAQGSPVDA